MSKSNLYYLIKIKLNIRFLFDKVFDKESIIVIINFFVLILISISICRYLVFLTLNDLIAYLIF